MSTAHSLVDRLIAATESLDLPASGPVCLAVSGGLDSVALLHLFKQSPWQHRLHVVHVHHGLRGADADADAAFVEGLATTLGVPSTIRVVNTLERAQRDKLGIEAAARALRYEALADVAHGISSLVVATAHTVNDQAETVLMRILRGTGVDGLQGIRRRRLITDTIACIRPLLDVTRTELLDAAVERGWSWREDSSNVDVYFRRNAIRHHVLPSLVEFGGTATIHHLARLADAAADATNIVTAFVGDHGVDTTSLALATEALTILPEYAQRTLIRAWLRTHVQSNVDHTTIQRVAAALHKQPGSQIDVDGQFIVVVDRAFLTLVQRNEATADVAASDTVIPDVGTYETQNSSLVVQRIVGYPQPPYDPATAYVDAAKVAFPLTWRRWNDGDSMHVLNGPGTQLVSDILTNAKVPPSNRRSVRVVSDAHGIIWLCGYRLAHRARCTEHTTSFLTLQCSPSMSLPTNVVRVFDRTFSPFISREEIDAMVSSIAQRLNHDYANQEITFLVVLNGAMVFASDLARRVTVPCRFETIRASSYGNGMTTSGTVHVDQPLPSLAGRNVVIVEDIVDSGLTMERLVRDVQASGAQSVAIAALLSKPDVHQYRVDVTYVGREIGNDFVVGYGLDYAGYGRELDAIWVVCNTETA